LRSAIVTYADKKHKEQDEEREPQEVRRQGQEQQG